MKKNDFSITMMEDSISTAEKIITKWDLEGTHYSKITSLFYEDRDEARSFISAVSDLKHAMNSFLSRNSSSSSSHLLARAHKLLDSAMNRLQKELHQTLAAHRSCLDTDSLASSRSSLSSSSDAYNDSTSEDADSTEDSSSTAVMDDIRSIAECMVKCGYTKECVKVYTDARRSVVEEGLSRLGFLRLTASQVKKLEWEAAERCIRSWVAGSRSIVRTLFAGERSLCDYVFGFSESLKEPVLAEVAKDPAVKFLRFPEMVVPRKKNSPERIFLFLDLYDTISGLYPEIETIFSCHNTAHVTSQARASLAKLGDFIRSSLAGFESAIQKDPPKGTVPGGGLHPLTRYVMNYLAFLADYSEIFEDILADHHLLPQKQLPEPFVEFLSPATTAPSSPSRLSDEEVGPATPVLPSRVAWLILVLLCKLDKKAEAYNDAALSYLFLANNMTYVVNKVRTSNIRHLIGEEWVRKHGEKAHAFARSYVRFGWRKVVEAIPEVGKGGVEKMVQFSAAFEEAYMRQRGWIVKDRKLREELKISIAGQIMAPYREFYVSCMAALRKEKGAAAVREARFTPDDIGNYLSDLFYGVPSVSGRSNGSSSGSGSRSGSGSY